MKLIKTIPGQNVYFETEAVETGNEKTTVERNVVNVYDDVQYQRILGFGGAFTESAAYNYAQLTDEQKSVFWKSTSAAKRASATTLAGLTSIPATSLWMCTPMCRMGTRTYPPSPWNGTASTLSPS